MKILTAASIESLGARRAQRAEAYSTLLTSKAGQDKRALVLGGGSQKGSFELGATQYLYRRKLTFGHIVGTSVGSINGVKLAEGERKGPSGYTSGLAGLERIWAEIRQTSDFLDVVIDPDELLENVEKEIGKEVAIDVGATVAGGLLGGGIGALIGLFGSGAGTAGAVEKKLLETLDDVLHAGGQYSLAPIVARLQDPNVLKIDLVLASPIKTWFVWVGQFSGFTFVTGKDKSLRLIHDPTQVVGSVDDLFAAIHASSAQPAFMKLPIVEGTLDNKRFAERGMDGGITEIGGVRAAFQLGAEEVYAVFTSPEAPPFVDPITGELDDENPIFKRQKVLKSPPNTYEHVHLAELRSAKNILNVGARALELLLYEVQRGDIPVGVEGLHLIRPSVRVFEDFDVSAERVDINRKHGWMCAFDSFLTGADRAMASLHTTVITRYQLEAARLEASAASMERNPTTASAASKLRQEAREFNDAANGFLDFRKSRWGIEANAPAMQKERPRG